jgi:NADPH2:quinone reductase
MVLFGQSSGAVSAFSPQVLNTKGSLYLTRPTLANYIGTRAELLSRAQDIFDWVGAGTLKLNIDRSFPLEQVADAHRYLEGRQSKGKIVLLPPSS